MHLIHILKVMFLNTFPNRIPQPTPQCFATISKYAGEILKEIFRNWKKLWLVKLASKRLF